MSVIEDLEAEMKRARAIIANCDSSPTITFVAVWMRALVQRSEQAIRERDEVACVACLKELREVKVKS